MQPQLVPLMTYAYTAPVHGGDSVWPRLLLAGLLSALVHLMIFLVPVNPTGGTPQLVSTIQARLEEAVASDSEAVAAPEETVAPAPAPLSSEAARPAPPEAPPRNAPKPAEAPAAKPPSSPAAGIEVPLIRDPTYYPARQLDVYPQPVVVIQPKCPEAALAQRLNGRVQLLVLIDEFGVVNETSVVEAQPAGVFEETAAQAFRSARFVPAQKQGNHVKSRVILRVNFLCGDIAAPPP